MRPLLSTTPLSVLSSAVVNLLIIFLACFHARAASLSLSLSLFYATFSQFMKPAGEQIIITMWFLRFFHRILNYKQVSACVEFFVWRSLMSWYPLLLFFFFFYTFNITRLDPEINSRKFKKKDETTTLLLATYSKEWKLYNCFYRSNFSNPDGGKILIHFIRFFLSLSNVRGNASRLKRNQCTRE